MYLPARVQRNVGIGRLVSVVRRRAAEKGSSVFFTQMLRVSFHGFWNAMYLPSGEICAPEISGLPKRSSRSISGGKPDVVRTSVEACLFWAKATVGGSP